ncbi:hypothetical protein EJB05_04308, partial [Eragrostis curvula]
MPLLSADSLAIHRLQEGQIRLDYSSSPPRRSAARLLPFPVSWGEDPAMPGLDWDLNLEPDQQPVARRLSFSDADSADPLRASDPLQMNKHPRLPTIVENDSGEEEEGAAAAAETPVRPPQRARVTSSSAPYPAQGGMPHPTTAPVATPLVFAPSAPLQSQQQQLQEAAAAAARSQYQRQLKEAAAAAARSEYQRQLQAAATQQQKQGFPLALVPQLRLLTVARHPAGYETKWSELHPMCQRFLLCIEEILMEHKYQSQLLDQCSWLHDPSLYNRSFELDASQITQMTVSTANIRVFRWKKMETLEAPSVKNWGNMSEVRSTSTIMDREKVSIKGLAAVVKQMMWNTDTALCSLKKLRSRFIQRGAGGAAGYANHPGSFGGYTEFNQRLTKAPTFCCYSGAPRRPSPFIQLCVARLEERIGECLKWIEELEQLLQTKNDKSFLESLESLSKVMSDVHDYFMHMASKVEDIHQAVEAMKIQYLNDRRCRGDWNDPFVEADRRESAKQEAAVRTIHPTLHLSPPSQPTPPITASVMASQLQQNSFPAVGTFPSSGPTLPLPLLLPTSSTQPRPAPVTNSFSSSSTTSSNTSLFTTPPGGIHHNVYAVG